MHPFQLFEIERPISRPGCIREQNEAAAGPECMSTLADQLWLKLVVKLVERLLGNDDVRLPVTRWKFLFEARVDVES